MTSVRDRRAFPSVGETSRVGVRGMPGIGKSVLATVLAHDRRVRLAYADGIFWLPFGEQPNLLQLQRYVATTLGDNGAFETEMQGKARLRELLLDKAALLICDDVWEARHADPFDVLGPRCRMLITTRDAGLLYALKATDIVVPLFTEHDAVSLLAKASGTEIDLLPPDARDVATGCDRLPLALALCGGMAFGPEGVGWTSILGALRSAELEAIATDHVLPGQSPNLWKAIALSVQQLTLDDQHRWAELSVLPEDETVPEAVVGTLWTHTGKMNPLAVEILLKRLANRSLLYLDAKGSVRDTAKQARHVSLHDLLHDYAGRIAGDKATLHQQLLDAYRAQCPDGWATASDDGYFFVHLRDHLIAAGQVEDLYRLLLSVAWLEKKAEIGLIFDLPHDFAECLRVCQTEEPRRRNIRLLGQAIRRDLYFIARYPSTLFQCLWNSGWWYDRAVAAQHYESTDGPWNQHGDKLSTLLEAWRAAKEKATPGFLWMKSMRPPRTPLGSAEVLVLRGHEGRVASVAVTSDGTRIISGSVDWMVRTWDGTSGAELAVLRGHESSVNSVAVTPDGGRIITGSGHFLSGSLSDNTVRVWDGASGAELAVLRGHESEVMSVAVTPDGSRIISGSWDKTVRVWDGASGAALAVLRGHENTVTSVAVTPDGSRIISGSWDKTVRAWDGTSGAALAVLRGHQKKVQSVSVTLDGGRIVSGSSDHTLRVWDGRSWAELKVLRGHEFWVSSVAQTPDGARIVSGSEDKTVRVWDGASGKEIAVLRHDSDVMSVAVTPDGKWIVSGGRDETVRVWDGTSAAELMVLRGHREDVTSVAATPDGRRIVSGSGHLARALGDNTVRLWDGASGAELAVLRGHEDMVTSVAVTPDGGCIVSGSVWDHTTRVWDATSSAAMAVLHERWDFSGRVAVTPDGGRVLSWSGGRVVVWDSRRLVKVAMLRTRGADWITHLRQLIGHFLGHELRDGLVSVTTSRDGSRIVTGSADGTVRVWDGVSGAKRAVLRGHESDVTSVAMTPDGGRIISGSWDKTVRVWDGTSGAELAVLRGHEWAVTSVAVTLDGARVTSESDDRTVRVWDGATGLCLEVIQGHGDLAAIGAGPIRYPYRALARESETVIERSASGREVARFPEALHFLSTHPSGRAWVGASGNHLYFITLEGDV